jgi:hypothetical protein
MTAKRIRLTFLLATLFVTWASVASAQNSWVEWTEDATVGPQCGSGSTSEDDVTFQKQWHAYFKNTCWDQSVVTWLQAHPLQTAVGECGCLPIFQAYSGWSGSTRLYWDGTGTDRDWTVGFCREILIHHEFVEADAHNDTDPPCPSQPPPPDCSSCAYPAEGPGECPEEGGYFLEECGCCVAPWSPILLNLTGRLTLSSPANGVLFDFWGNGRPQYVSWPTGDDEGWLVLDRDRDGSITNGSELFGNATRLTNGQLARHGFEALAEFDQNSDGQIDTKDAIFNELAIWRDANRDGRATRPELMPLSASAISALSLNYRESKKTDQNGNVYKYGADVTLKSGGVRQAYDIFWARWSPDGRLGQQTACRAR